MSVRGIQDGGTLPSDWEDASPDRAMEQRGANLIDRMDRMEDRMDRMEERINGIDARLTRMETRIEERWAEDD